MDTVNLFKKKDNFNLMSFDDEISLESTKTDPKEFECI